MNATSNLRINPQSPTLGARIEGINLAEPLSDDIVAAIRQALLDHEVLFFEDQELTPAQQRNFAARFGRLHVHPIRPSVPGLPEVLALDNEPASETDNGNWRSDVTFIETPPMGSILYAKEIPPLGGDTIWSSMRAAYNGLSEPLRNFLSTLEAEHDFTRSFPPHHVTAHNMGIERYSWARREHPPVAHPVVRTHPETGRDGLFVNSGFTTRILGISHAESDKLLELLNEHIQRPEYIVRRSWKPNSLAFWDNRVTQHYTVNDYLPYRRVMHRTTILGDRPFNATRRPRNLAAE
jgi:taurine dioxygenase